MFLSNTTGRSLAVRPDCSPDSQLPNIYIESSCPLKRQPKAIVHAFKVHGSSVIA